MWRAFCGFLAGLNLGLFLLDRGPLNLIAALGMMFVVYLDWRLNHG